MTVLLISFLSLLVAIILGALLASRRNIAKNEELWDKELARFIDAIEKKK